MAYLISQGVEPPTILAVTFTKKATREMQERVNKLIPAVSNKHKPLIATFHSFCAKFLHKAVISLFSLNISF
jgi:superfamily I DNA/RNA helicase